MGDYGIMVHNRDAYESTSIIGWATAYFSWLRWGHGIQTCGIYWDILSGAMGIHIPYPYSLPDPTKGEVKELLQVSQPHDSI